MKSTYQVGVKQRCRKHFRKFINRNMKHPENAVVLCFPGHEALEIFQIYDKLGIQRSNIHCLEWDRAIADRLRRENLGVHVYNQSFGDFVQKTKLQFDIVSLDFMGQFGTFENDIYRMVKNGLLKDKSIVFTNFCGARDAEASKGYYLEVITRRERSAGKDIVAKALLSQNTDVLVQEANRLKTIMEKGTSMPLSEQRDFAISDQLNTIFFGGRVSHIYRVTAEKENLFEQEKENLRSLLGDTDFSAVPAAKMLLENTLRKDDTLTITGHTYVRDLFQCYADEKFHEKFQVFLGDDEEIYLGHDGPEGGGSIPLNDAITMLQLAVEASDTRGYHTTDRGSYKYIGDNGMPMLADVFALNRASFFDFMRQYTNPNGGSLEEIVDPFFNRSPFQVLLLLERIKNAAIAEGRRYKMDGQINRVFLGSEASVHPQVKKTLSPDQQKEMALDLLKKNPQIDTDQVSLLTGAPARRIAAWKAHITMGTYA